MHRRREGIDVETNVVERPEVVAGHLERAAEAVGDPTRVIAAADRGFGTLLGWQTVDREIARKKLESMVEGAAIASNRLCRAGLRHGAGSRCSRRLDATTVVEGDSGDSPLATVVHEPSRVRSRLDEGRGGDSAAAGLTVSLVWGIQRW